jgi:energy-coupling factor transport system ATP-binding protein
LTVIIAEHEVEVIAEYADKVILLEEGKITQVGTPEELFPKLVDIQSDVGVRIPQITDFASRVPDKFKGSIPVTVGQAVKGYK